MESHEHPMADSVKSHEDTLQLLFDATAGFQYDRGPIKCAHCDQPINVDDYGTWQHVGTNDETCTFDIPADYPVRLVSPSSTGAATCGTCGLSWNDDVSTDLTPTPAGRCAFESLHTFAAPSADDVSALESVGVDVDDVLESAQQAIWEYALSAESRTVLDVTLAINGPTQWLSAPIERNQYGSWERVGRVEFHDSWAVPNETSLSDDTYLVTLFDQYVETYQPADD
jgi:hypothetical protein